MTFQAITTGEQSVSASGAITGTLDVSTLTTDFTVKLRVRNLASGQKCSIVLEDTAGTTAFTDALQPASFQFSGGMPVEGDYRERRSYDVPTLRTGATLNKLRFNCQSISGGTALVEGWIE